MNWIRKFWLRLTYTHPSARYRRLTDEQRAQAIGFLRDDFARTAQTLSNRKRKEAYRIEKLTLKEIALGEKKVFKNAVALTNEAKWLCLRGFYSRAFVLAKLAQEEFGKIYLLDQAAMLTTIEADNISWVPFWDLWRNHKGKSFFMKLPFGLGLEPDERINMEESAKLSALYVEFQNGDFTSPAKCVSRDLVNQMIDICDVSIIHARAKFRDLPLIDASGEAGPWIESFLSTYLKVKLTLNGEAS